MTRVIENHWNNFLFREIHVDHDDVYQPALARGDEGVGDGAETAHHELCHHPCQPHCESCRPLKPPVLCCCTSVRDSQKAKHSLGELLQGQPTRVQEEEPRRQGQRPDAQDQ